MSASIDGEKVEALVEGLDAMLDHMNDSYREACRLESPGQKLPKRKRTRQVF